MNSGIDILLLGPSDAAVLDRLAPGVFDHAVQPHWRATFLADARHHLVVARSEGIVVGMASAVDYVHPDKAPQLWINEVGVSPAYRRQGIGRRLVERLVELATELGCTDVWVLMPAMRRQTGCTRRRAQMCRRRRVSCTRSRSGEAIDVSRANRDTRHYLRPRGWSALQVRMVR